MLWRLLGPRRRDRAALAFSEQFLVYVRRGAAVRSVPVPPGLIEASAVSANMTSVSEIGKLASSLVERDASCEIQLVLPNLAVSPSVLPGSRRARRGELMERLTKHLAYPAEEARADFWAGSEGEVLGAAVRRAVVRQYEQVVEALGMRIGWVDAATLVSIPLQAERLRASGPGSEAVIEIAVELFSSHYSLVAFRGGELVDVRFKLRPSGDVSSVASELSRVRHLYDAPLGDLSLLGEGAEALAAAVETNGGDPLSLSAEEMREDELLARAATVLLGRPV